MTDEKKQVVESADTESKESLETTPYIPETIGEKKRVEVPEDACLGHLKGVYHAHETTQHIKETENGQKTRGK